MKHLINRWTAGSDDVGVLGFIELPFDVVRLYWLKGPSAERGAHAHRALRQIMICLSGGVQIEFSDGVESLALELKVNEALTVEPGLWRDISPLAEGDILLVGASAHFDESDYIRDYEDFLKWRNAQSPVL